MKKMTTKLLFIGLVCFSTALTYAAFAPLRTALQTARHAATDYKTVRSLQNIADIKGLYRLGHRTPLIGLIATAKISEGQNSMLADLFNQNDNSNKPVCAHTLL